MKTAERARARALRQADGLSVRAIAVAVGVSRSTASRWVRDIPLTEDQRQKLALRNPAYNAQMNGAAANAAAGRRRRSEAQMDGRQRARAGDPLHLAGCMLYWAEGEKSIGSVRFSNSDPPMIWLFMRFLRECCGVTDDRLRVRCYLFADNDAERRRIEEFWLSITGLPRTSLNRSAVNVYSRASKGKRKRTLPYGTCRVCVSDTRLLHSILGAIQEYGGFERPEWLG